VRRFIKMHKGVIFDKDMPSYNIRKILLVEVRAGSATLLDGSSVQ
jgi:hypothetical protein